MHKLIITCFGTHCSQSQCCRTSHCSQTVHTVFEHSDCVLNRTRDINIISINTKQNSIVLHFNRKILMTHDKILVQVVTPSEVVPVDML